MCARRAAAAARDRGSGSRSAARVGLAEQRRELVEQAGPRAHPVVLDPRAEAGELEAVRGFGRRTTRSASAARPRARPRRTGPPARDVAGDVEPGSRTGAPAGRSSAAAPRTNAPHSRRRWCPRDAIVRGLRDLVEIVRSTCSGPAPAPRFAARRAPRCDRDARGDRERQREPLVVVGVLADQVDAPGGERGRARSGIRRFAESRLRSCHAVMVGGDSFDGADQRQALGGSPPRSREVVAVASRDDDRARPTRASTGSSAPTAATRRCSPTPRSRPSTSRCRTRCTSSGRSVRSRPASTCSARSRSAATRRGRGGVRRAPTAPACLLMEAFMYRHNPQTQRLAELVAERRDRRAAADPRDVQLRALRPGQHPPAARRSTAAR